VFSDRFGAGEHADAPTRPNAISAANGKANREGMEDTAGRWGESSDPLAI